jgi:hypothetical protein
MPRGAQGCDAYVADSQDESGFGTGAINIYDIYADVCEAGRASADARQLLRALGGSSASAAAATEGGSASAPGPVAMSIAASVAQPSVALPIPGGAFCMASFHDGR